MPSSPQPGGEVPLSPPQEEHGGVRVTFRPLQQQRKHNRHPRIVVLAPSPLTYNALRRKARTVLHLQEPVLHVRPSHGRRMAAVRSDAGMRCAGVIV